MELNVAEDKYIKSRARKEKFMTAPITTELHVTPHFNLPFPLPFPSIPALPWNRMVSCVWFGDAVMQTSLQPRPGTSLAPATA